MAIQKQTRLLKINRGLTIVELLVAISILSLLAVMLVPQVRILNRERGIREAARVVGSIFVEASNRAKTNGHSAVLIRRNRKYSRQVNSATVPHEILYASTTLSLMKRLPPFTGNQPSDEAEIVSITDGLTITDPDILEIRIPTPLDGGIANQILETPRGWWVQLGGYKTDLFVTQIISSGPNTNIVCELSKHMPLFQIGRRTNFRLTRPLVEEKNSETFLPRGHYINLNYSGPTTSKTPLTSEWNATDNSPWTWTYFTEDLATDNGKDIIVVFGPSGGVERIFSNGLDGRNRPPSSALNLCICSDEILHSFDPSPDSPPRSVVANGRDVLNQEDVLWVSISNVAGTVSVSPIAPVNSTVSNPDAVQPVRILQSQSFRAVSQAAGQ